MKAAREYNSSIHFLIYKRGIAVPTSRVDVRTWWAIWSILAPFPFPGHSFHPLKWLRMPSSQVANRIKGALAPRLFAGSKGNTNVTGQYHLGLSFPSHHSSYRMFTHPHCCLPPQQTSDPDSNPGLFADRLQRAIRAGCWRMTWTELFAHPLPFLFRNERFPRLFCTPPMQKQSQDPWAPEESIIR